MRNSKTRKPVAAIGFGVCVELVITASMLMMFAALLLKGSVEEGRAALMVASTVGIGVVCGNIVAMKMVEKSRVVVALITGSVFAFGQLLAGMLILEGTLTGVLRNSIATAAGMAVAVCFGARFFEAKRKRKKRSR